MKRIRNSFIFLLAISVLCISSMSGQDIEYNERVAEIISQVSLDSLLEDLRILSGEDSVWIKGKRELIEHRISNKGNDLAADYLYKQLENYGLEVTDQKYTESGRNIFAVQTGSLYPEKEFIICAHYDAVPNYAADDNATGVAAVLEAARLLSQRSMDFTIVYALWDEEELGLIGSNFYASEASGNQADIRGVINLDMLGWDSNGDKLADIHSRSVANSDSLANVLMQVDKVYELDVDPIIYNPGTRASDHAAFWNNNYGAILLIEAYYGEDLNFFYHTDDDRISELDLPYYHEMSQLAIGSIATLAISSDRTEIRNTAFYNEMFIKPNPTDSYLTISFENPIKGVIELRNTNGQLLYQRPVSSISENIDISVYPKGIYFLTLRSVAWTETKKVVKY